MKPPRWARLVLTPHTSFVEGQNVVLGYIVLNWRDWQLYRDLAKDMDGTWYLPLQLRWLWFKAQFGLFPKEDA
jgi:hypothetical protein